MDSRATATERQKANRSASASLQTVAQRAELPVLVLWLACGTGLALITSHVADWYVMTDELLYERLAISIVDLHSPLPHVHGLLIANVNQLYPLLLAPLFRGALVPRALEDAHILNAFLMSSASVPTFLLARRVTKSRRLPYVVAALSAAIPWIVLSSFLMTEVVAYPAFLWTVLAIQNAAVSPGRRNDLLMIFTLAVATLARTQFAVFLLVLPIALYLHQFAFTEAPSPWSRLRAAGRRLVCAHGLLAIVYAGFLVAVIGLMTFGRLSSALGTYSVTAEGNLIPGGMGHSLLEHLAPLGLGMGIVPFVLGVAWVLRELVQSRDQERQAFAAIVVVTISALLVEVTSYDLRFGQGRLHDRYLFYVVPLILISYAASIVDRRWSRSSVFVSAGLLAMAFAYMPVIRYQKLNVDSPVAVLNDALLDVGGSVHGARSLLVLVTIGLTGLFLAAAALLRRSRGAPILLLVAVLAMPAETALAFNRLLTVDGTSGRPLTVDQGVVFDWIDRKLGSDAKVTMVPYPFLFGNYWENVAYWWNVEFWNASVQRAAVYETAFTGTPETFPTTELTFDRATGRSNVSASKYAVQAVAETRFRLAGTERGEDRGIAIIETDEPWRAEWMSYDLYRDGWTIPHITGRVRVFAAPEQRKPMMRFLTISIRGPSDVSARRFHVMSNVTSWSAKVDAKGTSKQISVCVPPAGFADVEVSSRRYSPIYGDPRSEASFVSYARSGGVLITGIALADETAEC